MIYIFKDINFFDLMQKFIGFEQIFISFKDTFFNQTNSI